MSGSVRQAQIPTNDRCNWRSSCVTAQNLAQKQSVVERRLQKAESGYFEGPTLYYIYMLLTIYLPFSDFRMIRHPGHARVPSPTFPFSSADFDAHLRGIGVIKQRPRAGLDGWVGEDALAVGLSSFRLSLPARDKFGLGRIRVVRKACYFDGLLNGRFEILISTEHDPQNSQEAERFVVDMLSTTVNIRDGSGTFFLSCSINRATQAIPQIWSRAVTRHDGERHSDAVLSRRCFCTIESNIPLISDRSATLQFEGAEGDVWADRFDVHVQMQRVRTTDGSADLCTLTTDATTWNQGRYSASWSATRYLRTYTFRMLQDIEAMSRLLIHEDIDIEDDRAQMVFNEYTRHVLRSHLKLSQKSANYLVQMGYSAFESLQPGQLSALRTRILQSGARPQVVKKLRDMLEEVREAQSITNNYIEEIVMGDKNQGNTITGDNNVMGSHNTVSIQQGTLDMAQSLESVAKLMRGQNDHNDAEVQATLAETAAEKLKEGDEKTAETLLGTMANWSLDFIKSAGTAALAAFVKARFG